VRVASLKSSGILVNSNRRRCKSVLQYKVGVAKACLPCLPQVEWLLLNLTKSKDAIVFRAPKDRRMKLLRVKVNSIHKMKPDIYCVGLSNSFLAKKSLPGQFLHCRLRNPGTLLRRPFSIHKIEGNNVFILFKIKGEGTFLLAQYKKGDWLDVLGPLGNGFSIRKLPGQCILAAGGLGVAPLLFLAARLKSSIFRFSPIS